MLNMMSAIKADLLFSLNGDFVFEHGDIKDSLSLEGLGFIEEVEPRIKSSQNDWYFEPDKGANLETYEGRMITPALIENIKESIKNCLTYEDFLTTNNFIVDVAVIDISEVAVKIIFSDNIKKYIDYKIQDVRIVFDLKNGTPRIVRL
jgi:hypothetical protein